MGLISGHLLLIMLLVMEQLWIVCRTSKPSKERFHVSKWTAHKCTVFHGLLGNVADRDRSQTQTGRKNRQTFFNHG